MACTQEPVAEPPNACSRLEVGTKAKSPITWAEAFRRKNAYYNEINPTQGVAMSIEEIDNWIIERIEGLIKSHDAKGLAGFLASEEGKSQVRQEIAQLRASINPRCDCKKS